MSHWIMSAATNYSNIENARHLSMGPTFPYERIQPHHPIKRGDWVYLIASARELYGTGTVSKIEQYHDEDLRRDMLRVTVNRQVIPTNRWVTVDEVTRVPELLNVYEAIHDTLIALRPRQINALNRLVESHGGSPAPDVFEGEESPKFIFNQPVTLDEMRGVEFKEIRGNNPVHSIRNTADEYAVAYLNRMSGTLYWGIRDSDRVVVGVSLTYAHRQRIRREVSVQFAQIRPVVSLLNCTVGFYPVLNESNQQVDDLWVCELDINPGDPKQLYRTGTGRVFMKTDGGRQILNDEQIEVELESRHRLP
jgi:hypothetical protein